MRVKITRVEIVEVTAIPDSEEIDLETFKDSRLDDILNSQDNRHETDDYKFEWIPKELVTLEVEEIK